MTQFLKDVYILSKEEYEKLSCPDKTYTLLTKTSAEKIRKHLLKMSKFVCWHDNDEFDWDIFCCSECPIYIMLGEEGYRVCLKQKRWEQ